MLSEKGMNMLPHCHLFCHSILSFGLLTIPLGSCLVARDLTGLVKALLQTTCSEVNSKLWF
jgi:hypothetical protein